MERDIFIISVYCLVVEIMQKIENSYKFRSKGFAPKLTDAEVITIEICGEFFKLHEDTEIYHYFRRHYLDYFPNLPDRTTFVRQSANLWQAKLICQRILVLASGAAGDAVQSIDTLPLPVCTYRAADGAINSLRHLPITGIARRKSWIITASNSACEFPAPE